MEIVISLSKKPLRLDTKMLRVHFVNFSTIKTTRGIAALASIGILLSWRNWQMFSIYYHKDNVYT